MPHTMIISMSHTTLMIRLTEGTRKVIVLIAGKLYSDTSHNKRTQSEQRFLFSEKRSLSNFFSFSEGLWKKEELGICDNSR